MRVCRCFRSHKAFPAATAPVEGLPRFLDVPPIPLVEFINIQTDALRLKVSLRSCFANNGAMFSNPDIVACYLG